MTTTHATKLREPKWHSATNRWMLRIGKKRSKSGELVEASFYWTGDYNGGSAPADVVVEAVAKQREFNLIKFEWPQIQQRLEASYIGLLSEKPDYSEPRWVDREGLEVRERIGDRVGTKINACVQQGIEDGFMKLAASKPESRAEMIAKLISAGIIPANIYASRPSRILTITEAVAEFLNHERDRVKLKVGKRIDPTTFNGLRNNLLIVFGQTTSRNGNVKITRQMTIDMSMKLIDLDRKQIKAVIDYWCGMPEGVGSVRTVKNYLTALKQFLKWCDHQVDFGWTKPKDFDVLFQMNDVAEVKIMPTDYDALKKVFAAAGERTKMYAIFCLTLGYYPKDIATIRADELRFEAGQLFIKRERSKEKGARKSGRIIRTKHWVMPELVELIEKHRAPHNDEGLLLLSSRGLPMYVEEVDGTKRSAAARAWQSAQQRAGINLPLKQLRKWGWNAVKAIAKSTEVANKWGGQAQGIDKFYDDRIYEDVTTALRKWRKELKAAGVLSPT